MGRPRSISPVAAIAAALLAAACGRDAPGHTLLDAASLYDANEGLLQSVRAAYPGPYQDFTRIPARDPAKADPMDADFLEFLRADIPVEFIDFFPIGDTGKDEIDVVLWRYQSGDHWNTVSLVYFSEPMIFAQAAENMRAFDECGDAAFHWLEENKGAGDVSAFCRINDHWQAFQRIE
ncbi:hypothetical protein [Hyphococcus sp.]|jgi:hypothetical protein|uniref:hypothetical protein n=1 Tax=Hyphococcus sp. TaxID=2038636 RepID=UPI003D111433